MNWTFEQHAKNKFKNTILIEGLPGIGNVGKVAVDFLADILKAEKIGEFFSYDIPHTAFVNEDNLVELPKIELFAKKKGKATVLLLSGDVQPINEESCYAFCHYLLDTMREFDCKEIITLGGIGLRAVPKKPKVYCTGTDKVMIDKFVKAGNVSADLYGVVGPIIGVSGVLVALAGKQRMPGAALLAETYGHPMYLGVKGARELLRVLNRSLKLGLNMNALDKQISELESEISKRSQEINALRSLHLRKGMPKETSYIG